MSTAHCDVVIAGGGLAGLTLARQLNAEQPDLGIVVLERSETEPPDAAFKVGESTVEIGAHYLAGSLGLKSLIEETQLRKFGLRFFFGAGGSDLADADELGASNYFTVPTYQIDRGRFERNLFSLVADSGVEARRGCSVIGFEDSDQQEGKTVRFRNGEGEESLECRWFIDASGRASVLNRKRKLERPASHPVCSAWFRVDGVIDVDDWSSCPDWKNRNPGGGRLLSTNHLMGPGYWVWIIPLVDGRTSVGLVSDSEILPLEEYNTPGKFLDWSAGHHPLLAESLGSFQREPMDFRYLPKLARDCKQAWSAEGWAFTGEAGVFADPFYSPGTDYIAMANSFITRFIGADRTSDSFHDDIRYSHALFRSFFASTMSLYRGQYGGFGDARLMAVKSTWDYVYYWSVLAWLYFRGLLTDVTFLRQSEKTLQQAFFLNNRMQSAFRLRAAERRVITPRGRFFDQQAIPVLGELSHGLVNANGSSANELKVNCDRLERVAAELERLLGDEQGAPGNTSSDLLGDLSRRLA